ncbi:uncharacterized protein LOC120736335 isoform X2 [Simochromis diagramma]|uniref:uncharacterized protein LOC120736335 isoform X2 n=1 Tax=Simochromis diagramma TaxID=43689 RepID=UPI001A7EF8CC|nr:uncharacterized protein LOC120736335 isoform X2 [Simochromis diagramma]
MTAERTASLVFFTLLVGALLIFPDKKNFTAESGQNITLSCRASNNITAVEWSRADRNQTYVLLYRDGHSDTTIQHPSFKNQVDLQDSQMKDGDVSLILKNVTNAHAGIYEVRMSPRTKRGKRAHVGGDPICIITLRVVDPPSESDKRRHRGWRDGVVGA